MLIQFKKNTGKAHSIKYIREDGSETWMMAETFFILHDLSHFAIEKTLGFTTAFNGMIKAGMDIRDFENREKRKAMIITTEAMYAENMANLFLMELAQGNLEDFNAVQQDSFRSAGAAFPELHLTATQINSIRDLLKELVTRWKEMPAGESLELSFSL